MLEVKPAGRCCHKLLEVAKKTLKLSPEPLQKHYFPVTPYVAVELSSVWVYFMLLFCFCLLQILWWIQKTQTSWGCGQLSSFMSFIRCLTLLVGQQEGHLASKKSASKNHAKLSQAFLQTQLTVVLTICADYMLSLNSIDCIVSKKNLHQRFSLIGPSPA